ncbi:hypothetical protein ACIGBH_02090 [Streptomyces sp. NPDC085929]|uniref:hypothetical protein n=1 Tax=Streptomyces sp. NPDC085929 TaxID=3365739 RepID=UPI0037D52095
MGHGRAMAPARAQARFEDSGRPLLRSAVAWVTLLALTATTAACARKTADLTEQQARTRAEEIAQQAIAGMSPKPTLQRHHYSSSGCVTEFGTAKLDQVSVDYRLEGVPPSAARHLVRQTRDAWVAMGYDFQSKDSDGDWSDPAAAVFMHTRPDDFSLSAQNSITDRSTGDGIVYITVRSPCYLKPTQSPAPSP